MLPSYFIIWFVCGLLIVVSVRPVNVVVIELRSAGVNVNTPVELLYANDPLPFADAVVTLRSPRDIPPPPLPVKSDEGAQLLPLYFSTCPLLAPAVLTSDKSFNPLVTPLLVIVNVSFPALVVSEIPVPATMFSTSFEASATRLSCPLTENIPKPFCLIVDISIVLPPLIPITSVEASQLNV